MKDPARIIEEARAILMVDWPDPGVPRALLDAGLAVFGYSPHVYSRAEMLPEPPPQLGSGNVFPPRTATETG